MDDDDEPEQLDMFRQREIYDAADAWEARVEHLRTCTVQPWWDSPPGCLCSTKDHSE